MKELDIINFSVLPVELLLGVALVLGFTYVLLKLVKRYLFVVVKSEHWNERIVNSWARIEISVWLTAGALMLIYLLNNSFLVTIVLIVVALVVGGKYWRDLINGVFVKFENKITVGDFISSETYKGIVIVLGNRGLQIRMDGGDMAFVPYRNLSDYKIRKMDQSMLSEMSSIILKIKPEVAVDSAVMKLKRTVLQIPYTMLTQPVKVEVVELDETGSTLRVLVHSQTAESGKLLEMELKQVLGTLDLI
jgi:small-conductance mechanosensitive channel